MMRDLLLHLRSATFSHLLLFDLFEFGPEFGAFLELFARFTGLDRSVCVFECLKEAFLLILFLHFGQLLFKELGFFEFKRKFKIVEGRKSVL